MGFVFQRSQGRVRRKGIGLLKERDRIYQGRFEEMRQEIVIGIESVDRGEVVDGELLIQGLQERLEQAHNPLPIKIKGAQ